MHGRFRGRTLERPSPTRAIKVRGVVGGGFVTVTVPILIVNFGLPVVLTGVLGVGLVLFVWPKPNTVTHS